MKWLTAIASLVLLLALPGLAQTRSSHQSQQPTMVAYSSSPAMAQDQDDRDRDRDHRDNRDRNKDRNWNAESDRAWHRNHRNDRNWNAEQDRNWHRGQEGRNGYGYRGVLAPQWQQKYDSYYQRWQSYRATNNQSQMRSMEGRMQSIMRNYNIPPNTPYGEVASGGGH
jgi:hypothetical protein